MGKWVDGKVGSEETLPPAFYDRLTTANARSELVG
jgi:hypothetical protein